MNRLSNLISKFRSMGLDYEAHILSKVGAGVIKIDKAMLERSLDGMLSHIYRTILISRPQGFPPHGTTIGHDKINLRTVDGQEEEVVVYLIMENLSFSSVPFAGKAIPKDNTFKQHAIVLSMDPAVSIGSFVSNIDKVKEELLSIYFHEATHIAEIKFYKEQPDYFIPDASGHGRPNIDPIKYYNNPMELRAFMQQVVDEVLMKAEAMHKDFPGFRDLTASEFMKPIFDLSPTKQSIWDYLTPGNKAKIISAVTGALDKAGLINLAQD